MMNNFNLKIIFQNITILLLAFLVSCGGGEGLGTEDDFNVIPSNNSSNNNPSHNNGNQMGGQQSNSSQQLEETSNLIRGSLAVVATDSGIDQGTNPREDLTWDKPQDVASFLVEYCYDDLCSPPVSLTEPKIDLTSLDEGSLVTFKVTPVLENGEHAPTITTAEPVAVRVRPPGAVEIKEVGQNSVEVAWTNSSSRAEQTEVRYCTGVNCDLSAGSSEVLSPSVLKTTRL